MLSASPDRRRSRLPLPSALRAQPLAARPAARGVYRPDRQPQSAQNESGKSMNDVGALFHVTDEHRRLAARRTVSTPVLLRHRLNPLARVATSLLRLRPPCQAKGAA